MKKTIAKKEYKLKREPISCPLCRGFKTVLRGKTATKKQMIFCQECQKSLTIEKEKLTPLAEICCSGCGVLGIQYRKNTLCKNCYVKRSVACKKLENQVLKLIIKGHIPDNIDPLEIAKKLHTNGYKSIDENNIVTAMSFLSF